MEKVYRRAIGESMLVINPGRARQILKPLEIELQKSYTTPCITSRADALANLPDPARWFPQGDAAKDGN